MGVGSIDIGQIYQILIRNTVQYHPIDLWKNLNLKLFFDPIHH
jgi:hypothetical protein